MTCYLSNGARVLVGRHLDTCTLDACLGCQPCHLDHCRHCKVTHARMLCPGCLGKVRDNLWSAVALAGRLHGEATRGRAAYVARLDIPGGDALVMLVPGADAHGYQAQLHYRIVNGLDVGHTVVEQAGDPRPPFTVLTDWADRWRREVGQPAADNPTLDSAARYLDHRLHEKANAAGVLPFARDIKALRRALESVLHAGDRPQISRVPCWECGARLAKFYGASASADRWVCPRCHETYDQGRYDRAKHDHLASIGADRYVLLSDAVAAVGRPEHTVRAWIRRALVRTQRDPISGRLLVWWPDVRARHLDTPRRPGVR